MNRLLLIALLFPFSLKAEQLNLSPIVVTATKYNVNSFDIPMSIDVIEQDTIENSRFSFSPAESLKRVPGLVVSDPFIGDSRVVTRGFGSYAPFATRGIMIYKDNIPVSFADGYGALSLINMENINHIEVMKGPFSSMYGNTSAGVMHFFTKTPTSDNQVDYKFLTGSNNTEQRNYSYSGSTTSGKYSILHSDLSTDGFRERSKFERNQTSINYWVGSDTETRTRIGLNNYNQTGDDNGNGNAGITLSRFKSDPYSAEPAFKNINSWKTLRQTDANISLEHDINNNNILKISTWGGNRTQEQLQPSSSCDSIKTCNSNKLNTDRIFYGGDISLNHVGHFIKPYTITSGVFYYNQSDSVTTGKWMTKGVIASDRGDTLIRNWDQHNTSFDQYAQANIEISPTINVHSGIRRTTTTILFEDKLKSDSFGGDNGGEMNYSNSLFNLGANWKITDLTNVFVSYGQGVETPNILQVQNLTPLQTTGPNTLLKEAKSDNYELGIKTFSIPKTYATMSVYKSNIKNIINIKESGPGYRIFSNQGTASTQGLEFSAKSELPLNFNTYVMYNYIDSVFDSNDLKVPGIAKNNAYAELSWKYNPIGFKITTEAVYTGKTYATTDNSVAIDGSTIYNIRASLTQNIKKLKIKEYFAITNISDRKYAETVSVDASNERYYIPGADKNTMIGVSASYEF